MSTPNFHRDFVAYVKPTAKVVPLPSLAEVVIQALAFATLGAIFACLGAYVAFAGF